MTSQTATDFGDDVPWSSLKWGLTLRDARGEVTLGMGQALQVFAAVELDRVWSLDSVRRALGAKSFWRSLCDGADGLTPHDAPGEMHLTEVYRRLSLVGARYVFEQTQSQQAASLKEALGKLTAEEAA